MNKAHTDRRLIQRFDCTADYPREEYLEYQPTRVVESAAGRYREADAHVHARFAYRFRIENVGRPHLVVVRYPDDKRRHFGISDGMTYDMTMGIYTGWEYPLSHTLHEARLFFYPRWNDCAIQFATWGDGEPAAAASIEVWELAEAPPLAVTGDPGDGSRRELGSQWEDPCGYCIAEGALDHKQWVDHVLAYARHSGQNLIQPILCWYYGPQFPSRTNYSDNGNLMATPDHALWGRATQDPADWWSYLYRRAGEEGIGVIGALSLMRLSSLLQGMNVDLPSIQAGADTYNNMLSNNQVQSAIQDWTGDYNALMLGERYRKINAEGQGPLFSPVEKPWGERHNPLNHPGPMFNPLHPVTQEKVLAFVQEILDRYAQYPAFQGLSFNLFIGSVFWFGSLHAGYDDYTVGLFERETGIRVRSVAGGQPIDPKDPERFSKRYEFLTFTVRPAWIDWRCRKVAGFLRTIRDRMTAARSDLRLSLTAWQETVLTHMLGSLGPDLQVGARPSLRELMREGGLDIALLAEEAGLEVDLQLGDARDRATWGHMGLEAPLEFTCMFRDANYLERDTLEAVANTARPGAFIFNCYAEDWAEAVCTPGDRKSPHYPIAADMDGKPTDDFVRLNCQYPEDGWWYPSQFRIYTPFPTGIHFLEPLAHAVAELDAVRITQGGLFMDRCHTDELRRFALAYRALPRRKFETVGGSTDPVAVRTLVHDGRRYLYLVNREHYPIPVRVDFSGARTSLRDVATGREETVGKAWNPALEPYELRVVTLAAESVVTGFSCTVPVEILRQVRAESGKALAAIGVMRASGRSVPGMDTMEAGIESALAAGRIAWLRRALTGYVVRKCLDETIMPWPAALNVSALQPGAGRLEALDRVPPADRLQWQRQAVEPATHFCNLHDRLQAVGEMDAVVWIGCRVRCAEAMRVAVRLGYDGPVKLFVDGRPAFHDPAGTNPAKRDSAAPEIDLTAGDHELALALGANQGRAWGVFLRLQRIDLTDGATPVLPEISR